MGSFSPVDAAKLARRTREINSAENTRQSWKDLTALVQSEVAWQRRAEQHRRDVQRDIARFRIAEQAQQLRELAEEIAAIAVETNSGQVWRDTITALEGPHKVLRRLAERRAKGAKLPSNKGRGPHVPGA
ncbi:MAG: hypothetical protein ACM3MA_00570 [Acidobacteriota bacterium]